MEEVVGSIPTRSTKSVNNLAWANRQRRLVCVTLCVITRHFSALGEDFEGLALGFHPDVTVPLQHPAADVSGNCHDG